MKLPTCGPEDHNENEEKHVCLTHAQKSVFDHANKTRKHCNLYVISALWLAYKRFTKFVQSSVLEVARKPGAS